MKVLHPICQQILKAQQWPQGWRRSVFIPIPKKGNAKECSNYCTIALISHASKVMLKILQVRLQQYMNHELPDVQAGFRKRQRNQKSNCQHLLDHWKSKRVPEKHLLLLSWLYQSLWLCGSNKLWKILKEMGIPDHLTCLLKNLYEGYEATVKTGPGTTDWFQIGKEYIKAVYCHLAYLNSMQSTSWETGWRTGWNQDCWEKYQQPQICRWHHPCGRKWRTKETFDESEKGEWKC